MAASSPAETRRRPPGAFAVIGLFLALVPTYVATLAHSTNLLLGGGAVWIMACSVLAPFAANPTRHH